MSYKLFVVFALAFVAASAYEDVDIPTFDTTRLGMYKPYMGLPRDYIMNKEMMDLPYFWWTKYHTTPMMMEHYKQDLPYDIEMTKMPYFHPYHMKMMRYTHPLLNRMYTTGYDDLQQKERMMMMMPYYQMMMQNYMMY